MKSLPRITIITPSYNQADYIEQTIVSVLKQEYPNLEYIVMDGGSNDGTLDILKSYSDRLTWFSEKDHGQTHAINKGMRMASGVIVGFLNSDDILLPGALQHIGSFFVDHPEPKFVTGKCRVIDKNGVE